MDNNNTQSNHVVDFDQLLKLLVLVAALLCLLFVAYKLAVFSREKNTGVSQTAKVEKTNVDFDKLPDNFPKNIPLEDGAKTVQNFNTVTPEGITQAIRTFVTKKTLAENYSLYTNFFKKDAQTIVSTIDNPTYKVITGQKGKKFTTVSMDENKITKQTTVTVSYAESK